tara:strand:- start:566 stop:817 length:252 start_codon:yes stop_codon:yes gene_type:complete
MNTEELEQTIGEGENRNTARLFAASTECLNGSSESLFPVQKTNTFGVSFVSLPNKEAQPCCAPSSERENSGFSIFNKKKQEMK